MVKMKFQAILIVLMGGCLAIPCNAHAMKLHIVKAMGGKKDAASFERAHARLTTAISNHNPKNISQEAATVREHITRIDDSVDVHPVLAKHGEAIVKMREAGFPEIATHEEAELAKLEHTYGVKRTGVAEGKSANVTRITAERQAHERRRKARAKEDDDAADLIVQHARAGANEAYIKRFPAPPSTLPGAPRR